MLVNNFYYGSRPPWLECHVCEGSSVPLAEAGGWGGGHSGPVVVAHPLLDVVQFGLQILAPALLHPIIWRL